MAYTVKKPVSEDLAYSKDAEIAERVSCPTHGKTCKYHATYETDGYHAFAICRKCGWRKEF